MSVTVREGAEHACVAAFEFDGQDECRIEMRVLYAGTEKSCEQLAVRLERAHLLRYEGEREPIHAFVSVSRLDQIEEAWCSGCGLVGVELNDAGICPACEDAAASPQEPA